MTFFLRLKAWIIQGQINFFLMIVLNVKIAFAFNSFCRNNFAAFREFFSSRFEK